MRSMRTSLAATVILTLVVSLTPAVTAQDGSDGLAPAYFTSTTGRSEESTEGEVTHVDGNTTLIRGSSAVGRPVEATDVRASGLVSTVSNADAFRSGDSHFTTVTSSVRLVNDDGAWSGTSTSVVAFTEAMALGEDIPRSTELTILTGEGAYEGLTLIMSGSYDGDSEAQWGVIVPTEGMPPAPDPMELAAE